MHDSFKQRILRRYTMPPSACCLQYNAVFLPGMLKVGCFVHDSFKQRLLRTSTMESSACCLQYKGLLLPMVLKVGSLAHDSYGQRLLRSSTMPSSTCCLQYTAVLLSGALKLGRLVHDMCEQRLLFTSIICFLLHAAYSILPPCVRGYCSAVASCTTRRNNDCCARLPCHPRNAVCSILASRC